SAWRVKAAVTSGATAGPGRGRGGRRETTESGLGAPGSPAGPGRGPKQGGGGTGAGGSRGPANEPPPPPGEAPAGREAAAAGLLQVGEQPVEVVAAQVAVDRLNGLVGAPPQSRDDGRHEANGVAPLRRAQVQGSDRPVGSRQRQGRDGVVSPALDGLDQGHL